MPELSPSIAQVPMPQGVDKLPIGPNGYPVPWFVAWIDGRPEFRVVEGGKMRSAIADGLCWICGGKLHPQRVTFAIGPMCTVNRLSGEPPSHRECAEYAVRACPFLSRPDMVRRENAMPEGTRSSGVMIRRNPGVTCLWTARAPGCWIEPEGAGYLFRLWSPAAVSWWREGRTATREDVMRSVACGLPALDEMCRSREDRELLDRMVIESREFWPAA